MTRPLTTLAIATLVLGFAPVAHATPFDAFLRAGRPVAAGPPNFDFRQGATGWAAAGPRRPRVLSAGGRPFLRLDVNTTVRSSPVWIPRHAQTLRIVTRSATRGGVLRVGARRANGRQVALGVVTPGRGFAAAEVGLGPVAGSTVSIVLDPVVGLGRTIDVRRVGPQRIVAEGWRVARGAPVPVGGGRVRVATGRLVMRSGPSLLRAGTPVAFEARGTGWVRFNVGARRRVVRLHARRWSTIALRVPVRTRARFTIVADPGVGRLQMRRFSQPRGGGDRPPLG